MVATTMLSQFIVVLFALSGTFALEHWNVNDTTTGKTCIIVKADPWITVKFGNNPARTVQLNQTDNYSGSCGNAEDDTQKLIVRFHLDHNPATAKQWSIEMSFKKANQSNGFQLVDYNLTTDETDSIPEATHQTFKKNPNATNDVSVQKDGDAYRCTSTVLKLENESFIEMKTFHVIAEAKLQSPTFANEQVFENCAADAQTSDVVPIIVGACLAGLVVIVLVAYLIGRARAKRQGYASV